MEVIDKAAPDLSVPPLWAHQRAAVERAKARDSFALFFDVGTGKSRTAIDVLRHKFTAVRRIHPTLILCPPIVVDQWRREILRFSKITKDKIVCLKGTCKQRLKDLLAATKTEPGKIVVTNYESLLNEDLFAAIQGWRPQCLVADESHRLKSLTAKRTKLVVKLAKTANVSRLILTGSPVLASPMDLFSQYLVLDRGESFGTNFYAFRAKFFEDKNARMPSHVHFPNWQIRPGAIEDIERIIASTGMRAVKADCLDLPPLVRTTIPVPLAPKQQRLYDDMKSDFVAYLDDKACVASLAITKALRLQQIVSGFVSLEDMHGVKSVYPIKDDPRAAALKDLLEDIAPYHKVLVWAIWRENYRAIESVCSALKLPFVAVHGDITAKAKLAAVDRFTNDPSCRVLYGHPASGGIGVNLTAASHAICYSRGFSLEHSIQAVGRHVRGGSERHTSLHWVDLVATGTIDEQVLEALAAKKVVADTLIRSMGKVL